MICPAISRYLDAIPKLRGFFVVRDM